MTQFKNRGFTIIELLVAIVLIAILSSVSIVAYAGISERAMQSSIYADLNANYKTLLGHKIDIGQFPDTYNFTRCSEGMTEGGIKYFDQASHNEETGVLEFKTAIEYCPITARSGITAYTYTSYPPEVGDNEFILTMARGKTVHAINAHGTIWKEPCEVMDYAGLTDDRMGTDYICPDGTSYSK